MVFEADDADGQMDFFADFVLRGGDGVKARGLGAEQLEQGLRVQWMGVGGEDADGRGGGEVGVQSGFVGGCGFEFFAAGQLGILLHECRRVLRDVGGLGQGGADVGFEVV